MKVKESVFIVEVYGKEIGSYNFVATITDREVSDIMKLLEIHHQSSPRYLQNMDTKKTNQ